MSPVIGFAWTGSGGGGGGAPTLTQLLSGSIYLDATNATTTYSTGNMSSLSGVNDIIIGVVARSGAASEATLTMEFDDTTNQQAILSADVAQTGSTLLGTSYDTRVKCWLVHVGTITRTTTQRIDLTFNQAQGGVVVWAMAVASLNSIGATSTANVTSATSVSPSITTLAANSKVLIVCGSDVRAAHSSAADTFTEIAQGDAVSCRGSMWNLDYASTGTAGSTISLTGANDDMVSVIAELRSV